MKEQTGVTEVIVDSVCHRINEITAEEFDHQITVCQMLTAHKCPPWLFGRLQEQWESSEFAFCEATVPFQEPSNEGT